MKEISLKNLKQAYEKIKPQRVALVSCVDKNGIPNVITIAWFMRTSFEPPLIAISIGHKRYSHQLIKDTKEFVIAFPKQNMKEIAIYCGSKSGRDVNKIKDAKIKTRKAKKIRPPLIEGCTVNFECKVINELETGDHTIFIGEIVAAHLEGSGLLYDLGGHRLGGLVED